jgi:integrase
MILLGVVMGLRACDIVNLKLTDIDWKQGEIKIMQVKNSVPLALPLTEDVGRAIEDYILHGRQKTDFDAVFLSMRWPHRGFANGEAIRSVYNKCRRNANLPRDAFDGLGFHSLRRAVGKNMSTAGVPIEATAQVMGDRKIDSVKKYIALDSHHLKECALPFADITPKGGAYCE